MPEISPMYHVITKLEEAEGNSDMTIAVFLCFVWVPPKFI